jgi:hypothetical protein
MLRVIALHVFLATTTATSHFPVQPSRLFTHAGIHEKDNERDLALNGYAVLAACHARKIKCRRLLSQLTGECFPLMRHFVHGT